MLVYLLNNKSTITHPAYDFDHQGNRAHYGLSAFVAIGLPIPSEQEQQDSLYAYELSQALENLDSCWIDLHESVGSTNLMVKINMRTFQTFTFHKGEFALVSCANAQAFARRVEWERNFYKLRGEDYSLINDNGTPRLYDQLRKSFIV